MTPSAFISYSWDDDAHKEWVRALAERLRADGVDVTLDRWTTVPGDQLTAFMERAIRENQFVIVICTPRYKSRLDRREGGVGYEGDIMTAEVMTRQNNPKFIPVFRSGTWPRPHHLGSLGSTTSTSQATPTLSEITRTSSVRCWGSARLRRRSASRCQRSIQTRIHSPNHRATAIAQNSKTSRSRA